MSAEEDRLPHFVGEHQECPRLLVRGPGNPARRPESSLRERGIPDEVRRLDDKQVFVAVAGQIDGAFAAWTCSSGERL
ncbi:MAG: hypothetical protein U0359_35970 [Byssovorax sp.]